MTGFNTAWLTIQINSALTLEAIDFRKPRLPQARPKSEGMIYLVLTPYLGHFD